MRLIRGRFLSAVLALALVPAAATAAESEPMPERTINILVYGNDPCPQSTEDEIVVCARRPERERYRIPKSLRRQERSASSWTNRVEELEAASRPSMPGSCSAVGSFGQSGCTQQMINQWYRERRAARARAKANR